MILDGDVLLERDNYRVIARQDDGLLLGGDALVPATMNPVTRRQRDDVQQNMSHDTGVWLQDVLHRFIYTTNEPRDGRETFERWARVFHNVNAKVIGTSGYSQGDDADIIAWPSHEWIGLTGVDADYTPGQDDVAEVASYLWGDMVALCLERLTTWTSDAGEVTVSWEVVDSVSYIAVNHFTDDNVYAHEVAKDLMHESGLGETA